MSVTMATNRKKKNVLRDIGNLENVPPKETGKEAIEIPSAKSEAGSSWFPPRATFVTRPSGVPDNVPGKRPPNDDSSEDENDESQRARRMLTSKLDPAFDQYDPKFYCLRYTSSGKPYRKRSKPYPVFAANSWGYLRKKAPEKPKEAESTKSTDRPNDEAVDPEIEELGLRTVAYPGVVNDKKRAIAKEMVENGVFHKSVNEVFRERYYVEMPYCAWCDFRPCMCYV